MDTHVGAERLRLMTNEPTPSRVERGDRIELQRRLVGLSQRDLAEQAAVSRATVSKAVTGDPSLQEHKLLTIETFLADLLEEVGIDPDEPEQASGAGPVSFQMTATDGSVIVLSGPPENADMLREQLMKMIRDLKSKP